MAMIVRGLTPCAICGSRDLDEPFTSTSGVVFPLGHDLYPFCDAPLHLRCLASWPDRARFSRGYFDMWREASRVGPPLLAESERWILLCGPARPEAAPYYAEVRLADWPFVLKSRWDAWPTYSESGAYREGLVGDALEAAESVMDQVRRAAPDAASLIRLRRDALSRRGA